MSAIPEYFEATGTDVAVSITRSVTHHRIGLGLSFDTRLDAERMARAVRLSLDAEPTLGCSFRTDAFRARWQRLADLDSASAFSLIEALDPTEAIGAFQAQEIPDGGPQAAVQLVRGPEADGLGIKLSHVLGDGQAAKQYAYLLADLYTNLAADSDYSREPNLVARPTGRDVWEGLSPEQKRAAHKAKSYAKPTWFIPFRGRTGGGLGFRTLEVEPERFAVLKAYGEQRGATINDLMLAVVFRALVRAFDPPCGIPLSLMCTADLRRYLAGTEGIPIANISMSGPVEVERVEAETFDDTLGRVRESMNAWASTCYGAAPANMAQKMVPLGYKVTRALLGAPLRMASRSEKTYPYMTNIGVIEHDGLSFNVHTPEGAHMYGPAAIGPSAVVTVSTYRDTLTACMGFCADDIDAGVVEQLLALIDSEIDALP